MVQVLFFFGGLYVLVLLAAIFIQDKMVFPGGRNIWRTPESYGWPFEEVRVSVGSETTHGWFIPLENARATILFSHGNGGTIADRLDMVEMFRDLKCNVLLYDYGGYGLSSGRPSEQRCYADVSAMYDFLVTEKHISPSHIIAFGESLGGAVAIDLASKRECGGVVVLATFLSAIKVGQEAFPFLPVRLFLRHRFVSEAKMKDIHAPILIFHSPDDEIIAFHHGEDLFRLANEPKTFVPIRGGHNDGFYLSRNQITSALVNFLGAFFPAAPPSE